MNVRPIPEKRPPSASGPVRLERIPDDPFAALVARLMDTAFVIPGTNVRFGLDAIIGLIPGVGDSAGTVVSLLVLAHGARLGVPRIVLARMAANILINSLGGAVPVAGDIFSVFFRSNVRNYELLQRHAGQHRRSTAADWAFVVGLCAAILVIAGLLLVGLVVVLRYLLTMQQG